MKNNRTGFQIPTEPKMGYDALLGTGFSGNVIVEWCPISERYWNEGDIAKIENGKIRLGGCWFDFDDRYVVKACA